MQDGSFAWYELMTSDPGAARAFYATVVGWQIADAGMGTFPYWLAHVGEQRVAGLMGFPPDVEAGPITWFGYVLASDVDAMTARVRDEGGAVYREPTDIPGVGRFAVVADPQGAAFMLFRGTGTPPPALPPGTPGTCGWRELHTSDLDGAFGFYQRLFGWEKSYAHDMGPMGVYQTFSIGGSWTGGMMADGNAKPHWLFYFVVDDIDAAVARIAEAGGTVQHGPMEVPGGSRVVMGTDPQGARFALTTAVRP